MLTTENDRFLAFLKTTLDLRDDEVPQPGEWADVGNTIGALALRLDLLSVEQLAQILEAQESDDDGTLFGQLAVRLGHLTQAQVDRLLRIQDFNRCLEVAERLVIQDKVSMEELIGTLPRFFGATRPENGFGPSLN